MKHTVRYLLGLLIAAMIVGMTACSADDATEHAASTLEWYTAAASVSSDSAAQLTTDSPVTTAATTAEPTNTTSTAAPATVTATVTTTEQPTTESKPTTTTAKPATAPEPITTTAKPVTTPKPIATTAKTATTDAPITIEPQEACDFVLNTKSMVFHTPECGSGKTIKAENRKAFSGTWEALVAQGYSPCGNCDPADDYAAAPETTKAPSITAAPQSGVDYILNTKSMKFHTPGCGSAKTIKEENRGEFSGTRDELIAEGYDPCGNCKP